MWNLPGAWDITHSLKAPAREQEALSHDIIQVSGYYQVGKYLGGSSRSHGTLSFSQEMSNYHSSYRYLLDTFRFYGTSEELEMLDGTVYFLRVSSAFSSCVPDETNEIYEHRSKLRWRWRVKRNKQGVRGNLPDQITWEQELAGGWIEQWRKKWGQKWQEKWAKKWADRWEEKWEEHLEERSGDEWEKKWDWIEGRRENNAERDKGRDIEGELDWEAEWETYGRIDLEKAWQNYGKNEFDGKWTREVEPLLRKFEWSSFEEWRVDDGKDGERECITEGTTEGKERAKWMEKMTAASEVMRRSFETNQGLGRMPATPEERGNLARTEEVVRTHRREMRGSWRRRTGIEIGLILSEITDPFYHTGRVKSDTTITGQDEPGGFRQVAGFKRIGIYLGPLVYTTQQRDFVLI